ncbi:MULTISPECIES: hypothetical protein [Nocardia]|uniref:hypothetical protein n=1 Tax=Nocardia TaxID=1817 RepID=UPI0018E5025D|nr:MULTISPECIES: hypothetical protein [Nocardia]
MDVGRDAVADHCGEYLGVADVEIPEAAVVVVLTGSGEVGDEDFAAARGLGTALDVGVDSVVEQPVRAAPRAVAPTAAALGRCAW